MADADATDTAFDGANTYAACAAVSAGERSVGMVPAAAVIPAAATIAAVLRDGPSAAPAVVVRSRLTYTYSLAPDHLLFATTFARRAIDWLVI